MHWEPPFPGPPPVRTLRALEGTPGSAPSWFGPGGFIALGVSNKPVEQTPPWSQSWGVPSGCGCEVQGATSGLRPSAPPSRPAPPPVLFLFLFFPSLSLLPSSCHFLLSLPNALCIAGGPFALRCCTPTSVRQSSRARPGPGFPPGAGRCFRAFVCFSCVSGVRGLGQGVGPAGGGEGAGTGTTWECLPSLNGQDAGGTRRGSQCTNPSCGSRTVAVQGDHG